MENRQTTKRPSRRHKGRTINTAIWKRALGVLMGAMNVQRSVFGS